MAEIVIGASFSTEVCCNCGMQFAMPQDYQANRRTYGQTFYCPNGHAQSYSKTRLQQALEEAARERAAKDQLAAQLRDTKQKLTEESIRLANEREAKAKLERRVANGVCPCCHRTVSQLARHMMTKHPGFVLETLPEKPILEKRKRGRPRKPTTGVHE